MSACESYDFTVNERVVYTPKPLFADFSITDPALQKCVEQAIIDNKVTTAGELTTLACSHAGITSLDGIEIFSGLAMLKLSSNAIRDLSPLAALTSLELLLLDDNNVIDTTPLLELPALRKLDVSTNPEMLCPAGTSLMSLETLVLPSHCL